MASGFVADKKKVYGGLKWHLKKREGVGCSGSQGVQELLQAMGGGGEGSHRGGGGVNIRDRIPCLLVPKRFSAGSRGELINKLDPKQ